MKRAVVFLLAFFLYGYEFYVPTNYQGITPRNMKIIRYSDIEEINFSNSFALMDSDYLPFILENNLTILTPIGMKKEYILSNYDSLSKIKTIANLSLPAKILLSSVNSHFKEVNATIKDFEEKKIDAIVLNKKLEGEHYFDFYIPSYGIEFNKYLIVTKLKSKNLYHMNFEFEKLFDFKVKSVYDSLILTSYYLGKKIDFNKVLFENYYVSKEKNEKLIVAITPNWPPFDIYENGILKGIGVDFFKLIAKKAELKYEVKLINYWPKVLELIKEKKVDLTPNTSETEDRKKYAIFSKPYYSFPLAIVCNKNSNIKSFREVKKIAVGKHFTAEKLMKKHYPNLTYIETKNVTEALSLVSENNDICAVDMLPTILWYIQKEGFYNLNLIYQTPFKFNLQIMIRKDKPELLEKINYAIDHLSDEEKNKIVKRYLGGILQEEKRGYNLVWLFLGIVIIVIFIFIFSFAIAKYRRKALTDELTNIWNRRGIIEEAKKVGVNSSVLFFDIDHFKKINDTYGHEFGDYVLKEISKLISSNIRSLDIFGRWGGEEFIIILRGTTYEKALEIAEKLRKKVEEHNFKGVKVTISLGVASFDGNLEESINKADMALYEAKKMVRNQVKGLK